MKGSDPGVEFICENPERFVIGPDLQKVVNTKGETVQEYRKSPFAQFERGNAPDYAYQKAVEYGLKFATKPTYEGGGEFPSQQWLSYYDSEADQIRAGWTDEEREAIERHLLNTQGVYLADRPKVAPPWPAYDRLTVQGRRTIDLVVEKIREKVIEDGYSPGDIVAYERENLNRAAVVEAMLALEERPVEEEEADPLIAA